MRLLASGRDADVFALSSERVLRRYRKPGRSAAAEAEVMRYAHNHGVPVPVVHDVDGRDLVMERLTGPTMADLVRRQPWQVRREARRLGKIHRIVHEVEAPLEMRRVGPGAALLHLDLHPENVVVTAAGPRVIDWTNAAAGPPALDVADVWLLMSAVAVGGSRLQQAVGGRLARSFTRVFVEAAGVDFRPQIVAAARRRLADRNIGPVERERMTRLAQRQGPVRDG